MNCNCCEQTYSKKYYKTHLKTKKHLKKQNEDNKLLKEGLKLLCKDNGNIIKDYIKDLEYVEEYKCEVCKKVYEDDLVNDLVEGRNSFGKHIAKCYCEKCFCFECWEKYYGEIDDFWCLKKFEMCSECYEEDQIRDERRDGNRMKINIMVKRGVIEADVYMSDDGISDGETNFEEWKDEYEDELENYDCDDYDY